jgi:hypothetical protein
MQPTPHDETADRAAEERSEDDGMAEHRAEAGDPARWAAERRERTGHHAPAAERGLDRTGVFGHGHGGVVRRPGGARLRPLRVPPDGSGGEGGYLSGEARTMTPATTAPRAPPRGSAPVLAFGLGLLSFGLLSGGLMRDAAAQQQRRTQERETQEEVAPCRVVTGETGAPAGRTTMGVCARAIQAGSGTGTWGLYAFEVERDGRVHVNGEYVGVMRWTDLPAIDSGRR